MRDKLIELIKKGGVIIPETAEAVADYLIANKVFVFPEKLNDSWELCSGFITRMFVENEEELEKIKREFELKEVKKILTDIRDYLAEKKKICDVTFDLEREMFVDTLLADLTEYTEKLGVEL